MRPTRGRSTHSLGNLLAQDDERFEDAKAAFEKSLELWDASEHQAQVLASWASVLGQRFAKHHRSSDGEEAERQALAGRKLTKRPHTRGVVSRVLGEVYEQQGRLEEAVAAYEDLLETNRQLRLDRFVRTTQQKVDELRRRLHDN